MIHLPQFPVSFINDLVKSGIDFDSITNAIFCCSLSDEECEEIEDIKFILEAELDKFLDRNQSYDVVVLTNRNQ